MPGFIQDQLEIKFLILYIAARAIDHIKFAPTLALTMCDDAIDYFDFSACLADLVKTQHLRLEKDLYAITEKGRRNSAICETSLPYSVRLRCDRNLSEWNRKLRRRNQVRAVTEKRANGTYTLRLSLDDDIGSVMDLRLMIVHEELAKTLAARFRREPEKLYNSILSLLLQEE